MKKGDAQREGERRGSGAPFLLAPGGTRLLQVQPTLRCNLKCLHCYSESSPDREGAIPVTDLVILLQQARDLGYGYVGVSGGEPLLWDELEPFLGAAVALGFSTSVTTNGTLLTRSKAEALHGLAGLVAVSVDGPPDDHAAMRGSRGAFEAMCRGLVVLRDLRIPFTIVFTLTRNNLDRLRWIYEFADEVGAVGLEVHPLAASGAASVNLHDAVPTSVELQLASWLLALLAEARGRGGPGVILDAIQRSVVERSEWPLVADEPATLLARPFRDIVPSLVIEADGCIVPYVYGFRRSDSIGFVADRSLSDAADAWRLRNTESMAILVRTTLERLSASGAEFIDLFAEMKAAADRSSVSSSSPPRAPSSG